MDYKSICEQILELIGGKENLKSFTNCMTRLRLNLIAPSMAKPNEIKALEGVLGIVPGEQLMVVLGPGHAQRAKEAMEALTGIKAGDVITDVNIDDIAKATHSKVKAKQTGKFQVFFKKIGNIFMPMLPAWIGCGLIGGVVNICKNANPDLLLNPWFALLAATAGLIGGMLHILTGYNASKEFGGTPVLGAVAAALMYSTALSGIAAKGDTPAVPLSLPFFNITFAPQLGGILGVIFAAYVFTIVEKQIRKIVPAILEMFLAPTFTILIGGLITIIVVQPIAAVLTNGITYILVDVALKKGGVLGGYVLSASYLPLVMLGIHRIFTPIHTELIKEFGHTVLLPILAMAGCGQVGMAFAIYFKTKNAKMKTLVANALPVGMLGIGEPLIYGVSLPLFKPFITACLGGGFGGAVIAFATAYIGDVGATAPTTSGLVLTMLIDNNMWPWYLAGVFAAYLGGFLLTYFFGYDDSLLSRMEVMDKQ